MNFRQISIKFGFGEFVSGSLLFLFLSAIIFTYSSPALAAEHLPSEKPLMVIRFNQKNVEYEAALERAVKLALNANKQVTFDIVAVIASGQSGPNSTQNSDNSSTTAMAERIKKQVEAIGQAQIGSISNDFVTSQKANGQVDSDEIRIFVN